MTAKNALRLCAFLLAAGVAAGCSNSSKSPSASSDATNPPSSTAGSANDSSTDGVHYPKWAAAVVPDYTGGIVVQLPVNQRFYQIQTSDDAKTVLAWYKARVPGDWSSDTSDEAAGISWSIVVNGVQIAIAENKLKQSNNVKTLVSLSLR
jgi:hypothetical protein